MSQFVFWEADSASNNCRRCNSRFTFNNRRHHCRACGRLFCLACCYLKMPLPHLSMYAPERVCTPCCERISKGDVSRAGFQQPQAPVTYTPQQQPPQPMYQQQSTLYQQPPMYQQQAVYQPGYQQPAVHQPGYRPTVQQAMPVPSYPPSSNNNRKGSFPDPLLVQQQQQQQYPPPPVPNMTVAAPVSPPAYDMTVDVGAPATDSTPSAPPLE